MKMSWAASSWMDVERYLADNDRVVVTVGACEQHGYMSLLTDVLVPERIAEEVCEREGVLMTPPLPFGISPGYSAFPGTITLRPESYAAVVRDLLNNLVAHGFRRILVNNGHAGNTGVILPVLTELGAQYPLVHFGYFQWWTDPAVGAVSQQAGLPPQHANWYENFPFTRVGPVPDGMKPFPKLPDGAAPATMRALLGDGSYGGPYSAPEAVMEQILVAAVESMTALLRSL